MKIFTNYRESHQGRGADYHRSFIEVLHRAVLWEREQEFLASVLDDFVDPSKIRLLDFACGTGRVIGVRGTIDKRDESLRATAQKIRVLTPENSNGISSNGGAEETPAVLLQFSIATTAEELREVREILSSSPGHRPVRLLFGRTSGEPLRVDAGADFHVDLTRDLEEKLAKWLVTAKSEREVAVDPTPV